MASKPYCAVCLRPVDELTEERSDHTEKVYFVARCHGRSERISVDYAVMQYLRSIEFGVAFEDKGAVKRIAAAVGSG